MTAPDVVLSDRFTAAVADKTRVRGLTHNFYKYPARFSPTFVRAAIEEFTAPGDVVADPFMGGGTAAVEALASGRHFVGTDVSRLAHFVAMTKTTYIPQSELDDLVGWFDAFRFRATSREPANRPGEWIAAGYQRHLAGSDLWPIRKAIEIALSEVTEFPRQRQVQFARAVVLRTAQNALDTRKTFRGVAAFRDSLASNAVAMASGLGDLFIAAHEAASDGLKPPTLHLTPAERLQEVLEERRIRPPRLIVTSPPYPGVHVLYHRWQIRGGRETPAPFWIADVQDGDASSYYTLADRHNEDRYFHRLAETFSAIRRACDSRTVLVQMVAFRHAETLLPRYLETMDQAGFRGLSSAVPMARTVPSRRWYAADGTRRSDSGLEYVLLHRTR